MPHTIVVTTVGRTAGRKNRGWYHAMKRARALRSSATPSASRQEGTAVPRATSSVTISEVRNCWSANRSV
jgi:hypothetical protein